jgi:hypothetical protein
MIMAYKWKPSKTAKREFAQKMQDSDFASDYYTRKEAKAQKRRSTSNFDYEKAGGEYIPTKFQHDFCFSHMPEFTDFKVIEAANLVMYGYTCQEKVHHDFIHIINELIRSSNL